MGLLLHNNYFKNFDLMERTRISLLLSAVFTLPVLMLFILLLAFIALYSAVVAPLLIPAAALLLLVWFCFMWTVGLTRVILSRAVNQTHRGVFSLLLSGFSPLLGGTAVAVLFVAVQAGGLFLLTHYAPPTIATIGFFVWNFSLMIFFNCGLFFLADNETAGPVKAVLGTFSLMINYIGKWLQWLLVYILLAVGLTAVIFAFLWLLELATSSHLGLIDLETAMNLKSLFHSFEAGDPYALLGLSSGEWIMFFLMTLVSAFLLVFNLVSFGVTFAQQVYYKEEDPNERLMFADFHH